MMRDVYSTDFKDDDWKKGVAANDVVVCKPILPAELNRSILDFSPSSQPERLSAILFRVVAVSSLAKERIPVLEPKKVVILKNLAGDTVSPKAKYLIIETKDVLYIWDEKDLE